MARKKKDPNRPSFGARMKNRFAQFGQLLRLARSADPRLPLWIALCLLVGVLLGIVVARAFGGSTGQMVYWGILGAMLGARPALWLTAKRAERGAYRQISGQPGEVGAALSSIRRGWSYQQEPIAADAGGSRDPRQAAIVYRAVGRAGVVLIAEGPAAKAAKLLASERRRTSRLVPNVPVHGFRVGAGKGPEVVDIADLVSRMNKLDKKLTKHEVPVIDKRLRSIGGVRPPIPAGVDPNRLRGKHLPR